jgi:predicted transcriptional regulator
MHTITLKSDDAFFEMLNEMAASLKSTRSDLIRHAVIRYKEDLEKEKLKIQIQKASHKVREESLAITKEFDKALADGLEHV